MAEISDADLQAMTDYIVELEAQVDFLLRERILLKEGAAELLKQKPWSAVEEERPPLPPGLAYGHAGQRIVVNMDLAYGRPQ